MSTKHGYTILGDLTVLLLACCMGGVVVSVPEQRLGYQHYDKHTGMHQASLQIRCKHFSRYTSIISCCVNYFPAALRLFENRGDSITSVRPIRRHTFSFPGFGAKTGRMMSSGHVTFDSRRQKRCCPNQCNRWIKQTTLILWRKKQITDCRRNQTKRSIHIMIQIFFVILFFNFLFNFFLNFF